MSPWETVSLDGSLGRVCPWIVGEGRAIFLGRSGICLLVPPLLLLAAGCGGVSTGADGLPPTPTVTPLPFVPAPVAMGSGFKGSCSFVWENDDGNGTFDFYEIDLSGALWTNGTDTFGAQAVGYYVLGYDPMHFAFDSAGMATNGTISLTVTGPSIGSKTSLTEAGFKSYFDATGIFSGGATQLGGEVARGGAGGFDGSLSDPNLTVPVSRGGGTITLDFGSYSGAFGGVGTTVVDYAVCIPG